MKNKILIRQSLEKSGAVRKPHLPGLGNYRKQFSWKKFFGCILLLNLAWIASADEAALKNADGSWKWTNRLIHETSPYLLLHAHNPVDWYPWGDEALALAKRENRLIFLSVGYATCYWCHVMEREVFSNPEIAKMMNEDFINIKIDREERPDLDEIYMTATQHAHATWWLAQLRVPHT